MSGVTDIIEKLQPYVDEALSRCERQSVSDQDGKIFELAKKLLDCSNGWGSATFNGFRVENTLLSSSLTLADLKTSLICGREVVDQMVVTLDLQRNLDKISPQIPVLERIQKVSDRILEKVNLFEVQLSGFVVPVKSSPATFALSPDEQFLQGETRDLGGEFGAHDVVPTRIREMEEKQPEIFDSFRLQSFHAPWWFQSLRLPLGQLRVLSGKELNNLSKRLPLGACRLLTEEQIRGVDLQCFKGEQIDAIMSGDGSDEHISLRLGWLKPEQMEVFLRKSSGCHFDKGSELFYQKLPLSRLSKEQVKGLLNDDYGQAKEAAKHRLQWMNPREVAKSLHLLSGKHLQWLSDVQIAALDFGKLKAGQVEEIFLSRDLSLKEKNRRAYLIPDRWVFQVIKQSPEIVRHLSASQCRKFNTDLLFRTEVEGLFPTLSIQALYPGYEHTVESRNGEIYHKFERSGPGFSSMSSLSQTELDAKLQERRTLCLETARKFTKEQICAMFPLMPPDVQEVVWGMR